MLYAIITTIALSASGDRCVDGLPPSNGTEVFTVNCIAQDDALTSGRDCGRTDKRDTECELIAQHDTTEAPLPPEQPKKRTLVVPDHWPQIEECPDLGEFKGIPETTVDLYMMACNNVLRAATWVVMSDAADQFELSSRKMAFDFAIMAHERSGSPWRWYHMVAIGVGALVVGVGAGMALRQ